jgi:hypothetical protein
MNTTPTNTPNSTALEKCTECTKKHLLAALSHLIDLEAEAEMRPSRDLSEDLIFPAMVSFELAVIYKAEAEDYGGNFTRLYLSELIRLEECFAYADLPEARKNTRRLRKGEDGYTLRDLQRDYIYIARDFRHVYPEQAMARALAHIHEARREAPIGLREDCQLSRKLYILTHTAESVAASYDKATCLEAIKDVYDVLDELDELDKVFAEDTNGQS